MRPEVWYKCEFHNRNKVKGNPTLDAKWNKCAKNARRKYRDRYEDQTLTCVHRWNNDLGGSDFNPYGPWRDSIKRQFNLDEFTVEMAGAFDEICDEAEDIKVGGLPDPFRVSRHKPNQAYAHHYVVSTGDYFKSTGEELTIAIHLEISWQRNAWNAARNRGTIYRTRSTI